jgi:hypothetical protein
MAAGINRQILLKSRPDGAPGLDNFELVRSPVPEPADGEVLMRTRYLSLDPYMRGRMSAAKSYAKPVEVGATMVGGTVADWTRSGGIRRISAVVGSGNRATRRGAARGQCRTDTSGLERSLTRGIHPRGPCRPGNYRSTRCTTAFARRRSTSIRCTLRARRFSAGRKGPATTPTGEPRIANAAPLAISAAWRRPTIMADFRGTAGVLGSRQALTRGCHRRRPYGLSVVRSARRH